MVKVKLIIFVVVLSLTLFNPGMETMALTDLKVSSVERVNRAELVEIIGDDVNLPLVTYWPSNDNFLKVELTSKKNLFNYIRKRNFTMYVNTSFCDAPKDIVSLGIPSVYVKGEDVSMLHLSDVPEKDYFKLNTDGLFVYNIILFTAWSKKGHLPTAIRKNKDQLFYLQYNLYENPMDICLSIAGGNMIWSYKSNEVKVTKMQIQNALMKRKVKPR